MGLKGRYVYTLFKIVHKFNTALARFVFNRTCPNQCVFIRGFRVIRSFWKLSRRVEAAAGPSLDPGWYGYDHDPDTEVTSIPADTQVKHSVSLSTRSGSDALKYRDPLHLLLDYITEVSNTSLVSLFCLQIRPILT